MQVRRHLIIDRSIGTRREVVSFHYGRPGGEKVYLQSGLHADEPPGALVLHHLKRLVAEAEVRGEVRGEVVIVPLANPIGLAQAVLHDPLGRFHLPTGENFNRRYPDLARLIAPEVAPRLGDDEAENRRLIRAAMGQALAALPPRTELESLRHTLVSLAYDADVVLDLHCDTESVMHIYTEDPYWPQAEPLCRHLGAQTILLARGSGTAAFDEALSGVWWRLPEELAALAGRGGEGQAAASDAPPIPLACFAATVELRGKVDVGHELAQGDAVRLLAYLRHRGIVGAEGAGPPAPPPPLVGEPTPLSGSETLRAPRAGVVAFLASPGQMVTAGEVVAEVVDPVSDEVAPVRAGVSGRLYARASRRFVTTGMELGKIAGREPFRTGLLLDD